MFQLPTCTGVKLLLPGRTCMACMCPVYSTRMLMWYTFSGMLVRMLETYSCGPSPDALNVSSWWIRRNWCVHVQMSTEYQRLHRLSPAILCLFFHYFGSNKSEHAFFKSLGWQISSQRKSKRFRQNSISEKNGWWSLGKRMMTNESDLSLDFQIWDTEVKACDKESVHVHCLAILQIFV